MTAAQIVELSSLSDIETVILAYMEAANGDAVRALAFAVKDALAREARLAEAVQAVSVGFVRGAIPGA